MLRAVINHACFAANDCITWWADTLCPDQNAYDVGTHDFLVVQENLGFALAVHLLALLELLHVATNVVHNLLLQAFHSLYLIDFCLLK